jgi:hypothetical protein
MRAVNPQRVEDRDGVRDPRGQRITLGGPRLVAAALTTVIGEDQAKLAAQRPGECRRFGNLERIRESRVEKEGRRITSFVLEIGADAVERIRRVGRGALLRGGRLSTYTAGGSVPPVRGIERTDHELGASDDAMTQMLWRQARAKVLARQRRHEESELLAREAVEIGEGTDMLSMQCSCFSDALARRSQHFEQAVERYERKENVPSTRRARARLAEIGAAAEKPT